LLVERRQEAGGQNIPNPQSLINLSFKLFDWHKTFPRQENGLVVKNELTSVSIAIDGYAKGMFDELGA
jgi:hypothetical protein